MKWMNMVLSGALCAALAGCGGRGNDAGASRSDAVPDVAAGSSVPDVARGSSGGADADERELREYRLTMEDVRRYAAVSTKLAALRGATGKGDDASEKHESADANATFDDMAMAVEREPGAREAIESAGLGVRQYVMIAWALGQARFADEAVRQGADPGALAAEAHINPENLQFVRQHRAEIDRLHIGD